MIVYKTYIMLKMFIKLYDGTQLDIFDVKDIVKYSKQIKRINIDYFTNDCNEYFNMNDLIYATKLKVLSFNMMEVQNMNLLSHFDKLFSLELYGCYTQTHIPNNKLHVLICNGSCKESTITKIPFSINFTRIDITDFSLTSINELENCVNLLSLNISRNKITSLTPLRKCRKLQLLSCNDNQLTSLKGIETCINLYEIFCGNNKIDSLIPLHKCIKLRHLTCNKNELTSLNGIQNCNNLTIICCSNNHIKSLNRIQTCINLETLRCDGNFIRSLYPLENLTKLDFVDCKRNFIVNVPQFSNHSFYLDCDIQVFECITNENILEKINRFIEGIYNDTPFCYFTDKRIQQHIPNLLLFKYDEFISSKYFNDNKLNIIIKYNLTQFYKDVFKKQQMTTKECPVCFNNEFNDYIQCPNKHIICRECFECVYSKKTCDICKTDYDVQNMFYVKY